jgi:hypothetical protein
MHTWLGSPSRRGIGAECILKQLVKGALRDSHERARRVGHHPVLVL